MSKVMAINCGSSSLKFKLFEMPEEKVITEGIFERIGFGGSYTIKFNGKKEQKDIDLPDHGVAAKVLLNDNSSSCIIQKFRHRSYNSTVYLEAYINSSTDFTVSLYMLPRYRTDVSNLASINYTKLPLLMVNGDGDINTSPSFDCSPDFSYFS